MWATLDPFIDESAQVEFLSRISTVLDSEETLLELTRFVDATVRRLDEAAITGTLLQDEWAEIRRASAEEREFATVAAAWGFDPYSMDEHVEQLLLQANATLGDSTLLAEFARTGDLSSLPKAEAWLNAAAARSFAPRQHALIETAVEPVRSIHDTVPWREGYKRARALREALGLSWSERAPVDDLVEVVSLATAPPTNVDALVRTNSMMTGAIVAPHLHAHSQRFLAARAIARRSTETGYGVSLLTRESGYSDKVERAFAAEFLAPAQGISELLGGDFGEDSQLQVATALGVSPLVISHQISNQLAA
ncbi:hypothetical protein F6W69_07455 [Microbacterium oxydans]|uniref:hypothetical protein n=1 Tax=Microbacterium oxydans TaxID=82380 RepID=UPI001142441A|nr:hypothetical protein [Microbacterium oxydans]KAB1893827.1 hypothetical protein F6W69_07455 [Microbacterium oxydans]